MPVRRRRRSGSRSAVLYAWCAVALVLAACSSADPDAAELGLGDGPARLALEPGDDPAEAVGQVAVTTTTVPTDAPSDALASTEGLDDTDEPATADDEDDDAGPAAEEEASDDAGPQPSGQPAVDVPDDLEALVDELIAFVENERGHDFDPSPVVEPLDAAAFEAAVRSLIAADTERFATELAQQTQLQRALGILRPDQDLAEIQAAFGDAGITALYDPNRQVISVRDEPVSPLLRTSLVFELTRALDDQQFGIRRAAGEASVGESEWSRAALVYGSAAEITDRYRATMSSADRAEEEAQVATLPRNVSLSLFTDSFLELQFGRQFYGEVAVAALWEDGRQAVDAALDDPPVSSELLIVGPEAGAPDAVSTPPADAAPTGEGVWGQAGWIALFSELVAPEEAEALTDGWGGDAWVTWNAGTAACVRLHVTADSADALDRYADALALWAENGDRQLFFPTADLIRVTACS